ncbi:unnamed protein product [marine sediment metagenome]|uniref:Uncharacterized protein n=1 Tax=marine sediment metagenome TaxID=412755 RepID=X1UM45_9ZZZZ
MKNTENADRAMSSMEYVVLFPVRTSGKVSIAERRKPNNEVKLRFPSPGCTIDRIRDRGEKV